MFKFIIDDQKKYKEGDCIKCKVSEYIDESADILAQHLSLMYAKVLQTAILFDIDERLIMELTYAYLEEYYPEIIKKVIDKRMKQGMYQYDINRVKGDE